MDPSLTGGQFLQRTRVLSFYRTILRGTKHIGDARTKAETRKHVRDEFERHRNVKDIVRPRPNPDTGARTGREFADRIAQRLTYAISCRQARPSGRAWRGISGVCSPVIVHYPRRASSRARRRPAASEPCGLRGHLNVTHLEF